MRKGGHVMDSNATIQDICQPELTSLTEAALHGITRALAFLGRAFICLDPSFRCCGCIPAAAPVTAGSTVPYYISAGNDASACGGIRLEQHLGGRWRHPAGSRQVNQADGGL